MKKAIELLTGANVYADHTEIKGKKSSGKEDNASGYHHWKAMSGDVN